MLSKKVIFLLPLYVLYVSAFRNLKIPLPQQRRGFVPIFGGGEENCEEVRKMFREHDSSPRVKVVPSYIQYMNKNIVVTMKDILNVFYGDRHYARFTALETIARVPYFSYTSVLHLYETLGLFRRKEYIKLHFAESWNELHHLLIMESLGGAELFKDRFVAQHLAFFYYWLVVAAYMLNPAVAYDFMRHVEMHAFNTYDEFLQQNEQELKKTPAPSVAVEYYQNGDLALFDAFHSYQLQQFQTGVAEESGVSPLTLSTGVKQRRPTINNLYDVFYNIRADEAEHASTMLKLENDVFFERKL